MSLKVGMKVITNGIRFPVATLLAFGLIWATAALGVPAVDGEAKMYWTNLSSNTIQRADRDGSNIENVIEPVIRSPQHIALDSAAGKIYWADAGTDKIQRADLDGSNVEDLVTTGLVGPSGIAVDPAGGKVYWTDPLADRIQRADLNGDGVQRPMFVVVAPHPAEAFPLGPALQLLAWQRERA